MLGLPSFHGLCSSRARSRWPPGTSPILHQIASLMIPSDPILDHPRKPWVPTRLFHAARLWQGPTSGLAPRALPLPTVSRELPLWLFPASSGLPSSVPELRDDIRHWAPCAAREWRSHLPVLPAGPRGEAPGLADSRHVVSAPSTAAKQKNTE